MVTMKQVKNNTSVKKSEDYWMTVLLYFASFLVGLGIVAEVAANWQQIPNVVKLGGAVVLMIVNAFMLIWCDKNEKKLLKQVVATIFAFLIMGTIGLIGQVFQLSANFANGCLLWSLASWPLLIFVPRLLWLWLPMFYVGMRFYNIIFGDIISFIIDRNVDFEIRQMFFAGDNYVLRICGFMALYGVFVAYEYIQNSKYKNNVQIVNPLRFYLGLMLLGVYAGTVQFVHFVPAVAENLYKYAGFFGPYLGLALVLYIYNCVKNRFSFMPLFLVGLLLEALLAIIGETYHDLEVWLPIVFLLIMLAYAYYHKMPKLRIVATISVVIWFIITFDEHIFDIIPSLIMCAVFSFIAYKAQNRKLFNTFVILAVLRILGYYADVDDLEHLGIYLIGSGLLMIATILGLFKYGNLLWRDKNAK